jgi:hypothetical protein
MLDLLAILADPFDGELALARYSKIGALYWSPKAWRPTTMGRVQPGTSRGTFLQMMGSRKMVPPRMLRIVPLGDFHIDLRLNSFTRPSSGVMVAHFTPTPCCLIALAASMVTYRRSRHFSMPRSK